MLDLLKPSFLDLAGLLPGLAAALAYAAPPPADSVRAAASRLPHRGAIPPSRPRRRIAPRPLQWRRPAPRAQATVMAPTEVRLPAKPIGLLAHWARVASVVERATRSAQIVREAQVSALAQLEMAEYALDRLLDDVSTVMPGIAAIRLARMT